MAAKPHPYLVPAPGRLVFREDGTEWPPEGERASTASKYIRRRIKDGDLVETTPPKPAAKPPTPRARTEAPAKD
ncbi:MAG: DUF2635 domain-containing protein [Salinarimonadaceae bacterium]|nr:MAG: DUF2635 domain-containing protein [Salinarimonadaceae bacterium]